MKCTISLMVTVLSCAAGLSLLPGPADAQGGPPLVTDDPGTPGDGRWEINIASTVEKLGSETRFEAPLLDLNYGLGERIQLKYEVPWVFLNEDGVGAKNGLGNSEIGLKYRFLDEAQHGVSMSIYPQVAFNNPTSSDERGLVDSGSEFVLPVQLAWNTGPLSMNLEAGYAGIEHGEDEWLYGLAGGWPFSERIELVAELHGVLTRDLEDNVLVFNIGGVLQIHENLAVLLSAGRGIGAARADKPNLLAYLGLQFTGT